MTDIIIAGIVSLACTLGVVFLVDYIRAKMEKHRIDYKDLDWYDGEDQ